MILIDRIFRVGLANYCQCRDVDELIHPAPHCCVQNVYRALDVRSLKLFLCAPKSKPPSGVNHVAATIHCLFEKRRIVYVTAYHLDRQTAQPGMLLTLTSQGAHPPALRNQKWKQTVTQESSSPGHKHGRCGSRWCI